MKLNIVQLCKNIKPFVWGKKCERWWVWLSKSETWQPCSRLCIYTLSCYAFHQYIPLMRKFHSCSPEVKVNLFRAYWVYSKTALPCIPPLCGSSLKKQACINCKLLIMTACVSCWKEPRWSSASELFCSVGVYTFHALLRNLMYKFMCRLNDSMNSVIMLLCKPSLSSSRYQSAVWKHCYGCLL